MRMDFSIGNEFHNVRFRLDRWAPGKLCPSVFVCPCVCVCSCQMMTLPR